MAKINWLQAKTDYISDETISLQAIAVKYGVSNTVVSERAAKEKWTELRKQALLKAGEKLVEKTTETIADVNARHIQTAKILQAKGMQKIVDEKAQPRTLDEARKLVDSGTNLERKARGMDKPVAGPTVNILNVIQDDKKKYGF